MRELTVEKRSFRYNNLKEIALTNPDCGLDIQIGWNGTIDVLQLNNPLPIEERARAPFEASLFEGSEIHIKSIQKLNNLLVVETFGMLSMAEIPVIDLVIEAMNRRGLTDALYPAGTLLKKTNVFFSPSGFAKDLSTAGGSYISASTARAIPSANILAFTHNKEVLSIPLASVARTKNWLQEARLLARCNSEVVYLGRPEGNLLAISTENDVPYYINVVDAQKKQITGIKDVEEFRGAALVGRVRGNNIAFVKKTEAKTEAAVELFPADQFRIQ